MAGLALRVDYLTGFSCPVAGPAAGKPHVLCLGAEIFLSTGRELVYVYDLEGRQLTAVYRLPAPVWHLEVLALRRVLYVLCAQRGIYCLSLDQASRSVNQSDRDDEDSEPPVVIPVDPDTCVLPDGTLCAFTVLDHVLITLAQGPTRWKMQLFECPCPGEDPRPPCPIGEVELSTYTPPAGSPQKPTVPCFLPVLYSVSPPGSRYPHSHLQCPRGFMLERALFGLLFGTDASILESPVILCGLPDGQLCSVVLKTLVTSRLAPGGPNALVRILHHLEEPVIFIGTLRTEPLAENIEDAYSDCLVALGHHGRTLAVKASWDEVGNLVPELREYCLPGPVLCAACGRDGRVYHTTPSNLCVVDLAQGDTSQDPAQPDSPGGLPSLLCPASLSVCSIITLSLLARSPEGSTELLALSAKGRLMTCSLDLSSETPRPTTVIIANMGQKIKDLLCGIGTISERVSSLKKAVDQRNRALSCLNEAMNVSCALLSRREGLQPISCTITTSWSRRELQDVLTATCRLENNSLRLDQGWALCIQVLPHTYTSDPDLVGLAVTYTIPVDQLGPGGQQEVTLPLGPDEDSMLNLPVTVSCALFHSLREVVGGALVPSDTYKDPSLDGCTLDVLPEQEGICLPLSMSLCCATLQWLLTENVTADVVRAQALSSVQGVAPDGTNIGLIIHEVAVTDLCPAGPIQAVEIQVESSSLDNMCRTHHAVIRRMQRMVMEQAAWGSSPLDLRVQYLQQIQANHETLLWEVQTLRDRLCTEDKANSCATAERLLQVYKQLRSPSFLLL
ncbi:Fanconi anemia core complex-associated protein 100 isoform X2 [Saccopteryx leptura]|uniref:Fanconi anemia core complex-associated protein 100 isoform X2 n=1 Tax=Saccopteryx leptura TaxID=249018 RepID=UPI00339C9367